MAEAFSVKAQPNSLSIEAGSTDTIKVTVSNLTGRSVTGVVHGVLVADRTAGGTGDPSVAGWLKPPAGLQGPYGSDPVATQTHLFTVDVPENALPQTVTFKASAWDILLPDDTRVEGQPVTITVTPKPNGPLPPPWYKRWWFWLIVGLVVVALGVVAYVLFGKRGVPNVVGDTPAEATSKLTKAGFAPVNIIDTVGKQDGDTNTVLRQVPEAKSKLPDKDDTVKTAATIVVNRQQTEVPAILGQPILSAVTQLQSAGLQVGRNSGRWTGDRSQDNRIFSVTPEVGSKVPRGSPVNLVVYAWSETPPLKCPPICIIGPRPEWGAILKQGGVLTREREMVQPNR